MRGTEKEECANRKEFPNGRIEVGNCLKVLLITPSVKLP